MNMIERVANAIGQASEDLTDHELYQMYMGSKSDAAKAIAKAAIEAMREPTPDMNIKGGIAISNADETAETLVDCSSACWAAMIDEALKDG